MAPQPTSPAPPTDTPEAQAGFASVLAGTPQHSDYQQPSNKVRSDAGPTNPDPANPGLSNPEPTISGLPNPLAANPLSANPGATDAVPPGQTDDASAGVGPILAPLGTSAHPTTTAWLQQVAGAVGAEVTQESTAEAAADGAVTAAAISAAAASAGATPTLTTDALGGAPASGESVGQPPTGISSAAPLPTVEGSLQQAAAIEGLPSDVPSDAATPAGDLSAELSASGPSQIAGQVGAAAQRAAADDAAAAADGTPSDDQVDLTQLDADQPQLEGSEAMPHAAASTSQTDVEPGHIDSIDLVNIEAAATSEPSSVGPTSRPVIDSGTLQRVEAALEQLENAPPPRTIVLDFDEDGIRIRLSSSDDGVQVDVQSEDRGRQRALEDQLRQNLADRGFDLAGEQHDQGGGQGNPDTTASPTTNVRTRAHDNAIRL